MEVLREVLINKFTQAIREGNAGIFAGAVMWIGKIFWDHWLKM